MVHFSGERAKPGSATVMDINGQRFLITAKHLCTDEPEEHVTLAHPWTKNGSPFPTVLVRVGERDEVGDIAVFRLPPKLLVGIVGAVEIAQPGDYFFSQDCFILGYPYRLSLTFDEESTQRLPLAKRGIIAGAKGSGSGRILYLDLIANPGFSGGPVLSWDPNTREHKMLAVVAQALAGPLHEPTEAEPDPPRVAAGISLATDVAAALQLIAQG